MIIAIAINCIRISELKASSTHTGACTFAILVTQPEYARFDTDWETAIHISSVKSPFTLDKSGSPTNLVLVVGTWALVSTCGYLVELETCVLAINLLLRFFGFGAGFTSDHPCIVGIQCVQFVGGLK